MDTGLVCWKCGASLAEVLLPIRRIEECAVCGAQLHVCRLCEFHDTRVAKACRETIADEVKDKEHANFCDYFKPRPGAYKARNVAAADAAKAALDGLFGAAPAAGSAPSAADAKIEADRARAALDNLFGRKP